MRVFAALVVIALSTSSKPVCTFVIPSTVLSAPSSRDKSPWLKSTTGARKMIFSRVKSKGIGWLGSFLARFVWFSIWQMKIAPVLCPTRATLGFWLAASRAPSSWRKNYHRGFQPPESSRMGGSRVSFFINDQMALPTFAR